MNIIKKLEEHHGFNQSEIALSDYILKNREKVLEMSIQELAQKTYSSTSTIVRLCQKIGLKGYQHFKITLSANLQKDYDNIGDINADFPFTNKDSYMEIFKKMLELSSESLVQTYELLSVNQVEEAVKMILQAERVGLFAAGDNYIAALSFHNRMMKINKNIIISTLPYEDRQLALTFGPNDCAIVMSYSGENKDMILLTKILHANKVKIISICAEEKSHVSEISDVLLPVYKKEDKSIKFSTFSSQISIEYTLNILFSCLFVADFEKNEKLRIKSETYFLNARL